MVNKAVFLDRDGVLNREKGNYITRVEDFEVLTGVPEALKTLQDAGYLLVVITNQGGIAKGLYDANELNAMHRKLIETVAESGVQFTEVYYCPHHPDYGLCLCRKPGSLMVEKAMARFHIDPDKSYFIGDRDRDIGCAKGAGVTGILVESNRDLRETIQVIPL